jgi:hypothetical protein
MVFDIPRYLHSTLRARALVSASLLANVHIPAHLTYSPTPLFPVSSLLIVENRLMPMRSFHHCIRRIEICRHPESVHISFTPKYPMIQTYRYSSQNP